MLEQDIQDIKAILGIPQGQTGFYGTSFVSTLQSILTELQNIRSSLVSLEQNTIHNNPTKSALEKLTEVLDNFDSALFTKKIATESNKKKKKKV